MTTRPYRLIRPAPPEVIRAAEEADEAYNREARTDATYILAGVGAALWVVTLLLVWGLA